MGEKMVIINVEGRNYYAFEASAFNNAKAAAGSGYQWYEEMSKWVREVEVEMDYEEETER